MPTGDNSELQFEAGQNATAMSALTDSGDQTTFTSAASLWSDFTGYAPDVRPDGVISGGIVSAAASGSNNVIDVSALTAYVKGVKLTVAAETDVTVARPTVSNYLISSIQVDENDNIEVVQGTEGSAFSETRAAAGGPPLIPVDAVELGQVRYSAQTAAAVLASEIKAVVGQHREVFDNPSWSELNGAGSVEFVDALPNIHTGTVPKNIYASYAAPVFAKAQRSRNYKPSSNSHSVGSAQYYGETLGSVQSSVGQGSFEMAPNDGITDPLVKLADEVLWFKFFPDKTKVPYILDQGKLGVDLDFPADDLFTAACTISAETAHTKVAA